jgi:hypothetical protein
LAIFQLTPPARAETVARTSSWPGWTSRFI